MFLFVTPPKFNIAPEILGLEDEFPFGKASGAMLLVLGSVIDGWGVKVFFGKI